MAKKPATIAPRIDPIVLTELAEGLPGDLGARDRIEGLRFEGLDLTGRDLTGATISECALVEIELSEAALRGASVVESTLERVNAPILRAPRSRWKDVVLSDSRIGSGELYESSVTSVRIRNCRLGYINLRGAELRDVEFVGCTIDELDLGGANAQRVAIVDSTVASLDLTRATLKDVDLRGAELRELTGLEGLSGTTLSELQVALLAPLFAAHFGIRVE